MKKYIMLTIILLLTIQVCKSQNEREIARRDNLVKECNCPNQVFNTDSVYSFFQSKPLMPLDNETVDRYFIVEDKPIPYDTIIQKIDKDYLLEVLEYHYRDYSLNRKEEIIPPLILRKMVSAILDSTTRYTYPIKKWNCAELGEKWITKSNWEYYNQLLHKRMMKSDEKEYKKFMWTYGKANVPIDIKMSLPVFDTEYNYAFMLFGIDDGGGSDTATQRNFAFAIFKREKTGWSPILVSKGNLVRTNKDFRSY